MEKFSRTRKGYDPEEVNAFLDQVISQVERMIQESKIKDAEIFNLKKSVSENEVLKEKLANYERIETTLNRAIIMAEKTSEQMKLAAHKEREIIIEDAKTNASRIVNDALLRAEKSELEADTLKRNINIFKRRLRNIIEEQLKNVDEIDQIEM
ncbi:MAG: DivIVA domain-containing protein [Bacilli bacterium]|nr:DivIVA domain-containing protein [Bacilli bacterium]